MKKHYVSKAVGIAATVLISLAVMGCESTKARPAALTGEEQSPPAQHERHQTGIESQARDM